MTLHLPYERACEDRWMRLANILVLYYRTAQPLYEAAPWTERQIAKLYGVSGPRINQLRRKALRYIARSIHWQRTTAEGQAHPYQVEQAVVEYPRLWKAVQQHLPKEDR